MSPTTVCVGAAALNLLAGSWKRNKELILEACEMARVQGVDFLCLPELCITGYGMEDRFLAAKTCERAWKILKQIQPQTQGQVVTVGLPVLIKKAIYNVTAVLVDGRIAALIPKKSLAGSGVHYEPRWFKAWPVGLRIIADMYGEKIPMGDFLGIDIDGILLAFEQCEEAWTDQRPLTRFSRHGVDVIFNASASHFGIGKHKIRERFVLEGARASGAAYVYANMLGVDSGRSIYDGDLMIASGGSIVARGKRFSYKDIEMCSAVIDVAGNRTDFAANPWAQPDFDDSACLKIEGFSLNKALRRKIPTDTQPEKEAWESSPNIKFEELVRALSLALFDYMRKARQKGFVVSLSGGVDSTMCSVLIRYMTEFAVAQLGLDGFKEKLPHMQAELANCSTPDGLMRHLLRTVYQATENSGSVTRTAAAEVAKAIGATHYDISIQEVVTFFEKIFATAVHQTEGLSLEDTTLNWTNKKHDFPKQNLQARVRSPFPWLLANFFGALLLTTSNRSEAGVGYCTMDGDTSGGLAPLNGVDKTDLRDCLVWIEKEGPQGVGPISAVSHVNKQQPTAELRPQAMAQTDEQDLMPYPVLDRLACYAAAQHKDPVEAFMLLARDYVFNGTYTAEQIKLWTKRFYILYSTNQWKRERFALGFIIDRYTLDPKTGTRWPVLSDAFAEEREELEKFDFGLAA